MQNVIQTFYLDLIVCSFVQIHEIRTKSSRADKFSYIRRVHDALTLLCIFPLENMTNSCPDSKALSVKFEGRIKQSLKP